MAKHVAVNEERIFEARYERGYRYLDRCGDAMMILEAALTDLVGYPWIPDDMKPQGAQMRCPEADLYVRFDAERLLVVQVPWMEQSQVDFQRVAETALAVITGRFDLRSFSRLAVRGESRLMSIAGGGR